MENFEARLRFDEELIAADNLVSRLSKRDCQAISTLVDEGYQADESSRALWMKRNEAAMDLALQVQKAKSFPWPNASNVVFPLVTIAAMQFHSEAYPVLIQGPEVVRYRTFGSANHLMTERAERVGRHMSWQCLEEDTEWEEQHDRLLINLPIVGTCFMKSYWSAALGCPTDELVLAQDLVVNYGAKSFADAERATHLIALSRNKIWERCEDGLFVDVRGEPWFRANAPLSAEITQRDMRQGQVGGITDRTTKFCFYESHCSFDLDGDGYEEPYIATVARDSKALVRLVARVDERKAIKTSTKTGKISKITPQEYFTKFSFLPSADNGFYDLGFGKLLGPINESVSTSINQLIDNATLQNSSGGFFGRGVKIRGGVYTFKPWEWQRVDSTGDDLKKGIYPFPEKREPTTMFQLLSLLLDYSNRISGTTDPMVGENPGQNTPAQTFQGMQEQGRKIYRQIFKRVWRSQRREYQKRYEINGHALPLTSFFGPRGQFIHREDYKQDSDMIAPVADPNSPSSAMRLQQALAIKQSAMMTPGYDLERVERAYLKALQIEDIEQIYPGPKKVPPLPNPKMQMEQVKAQMQKEKLAYERWKRISEMQEQKALNQAQVMKLHAESAKLISEIGAERARLALEAFQAVTEHLNAQNEQLTQRIGMIQQSMQGDEGESDKGGDERGGVPGMAEGAGDTGDQSNAGGMAGEPQGAMGLGDFLGGGSGGDAGGEPASAGAGAAAGGPEQTGVQ